MARQVHRSAIDLTSGNGQVDARSGGRLAISQTGGYELHKALHCRHISWLSTHHGVQPHKVISNPRNLKPFRVGQSRNCRINENVVPISAPSLVDCVARVFWFTNRRT